MVNNSEIVNRYISGESYSDIKKNIGVCSARISKLVKGLQSHKDRCILSKKQGKGKLTESGRLSLSEKAKDNIKRSGKIWTKPEQKFKKILNNIGIGVSFPDDLQNILNVCSDIDGEVCFQYPIQRYVCDFVDVKRKIVYNINGDFWHGNPLLYNDLSPIQKHNHKHDINKNKFLTKHGYTVCDIWESEINWNIPLVEEKVRASRKRVTPSALQAEVAEFESQDAHDWSEKLRLLWFKKPKQKIVRNIICKNCNKSFIVSANNKRLITRNVCSKDCVNKFNRKVSRPAYSQLIQDLQVMSYCAVGRKYGVSDNAIRKWIKNRC